MTERKFTPPTEFPAEYVNGHGEKDGGNPEIFVEEV